jgi:hypothetical protein
MNCADSLQEECYKLFADYPLAVKALNGSGTTRSIVLMLQDSDNAGFFVLSDDCNDHGGSYSVCPWPTGDVVDITANGELVTSDMVVNVVSHGIPIPRDGSLFGWTSGDVITALFVVYAEYTPARPEPGWSVMPGVGIPEVQWPPFAGERLFGHWSWGDYQTGRVISLDDLIAEHSDTVFWANTAATLNANCCAVRHDIRSPSGSILPRGRYVYYQVLRAGTPVPPLEELLADTSKIDLAPRFRYARQREGLPQGQPMQVCRQMSN